MANCETIYYQSTNGTILLGDFLYQNQAQTIPASNGYYSDATYGKWYETDAEGVVINSGSCLDSGVKLATSQSTAFAACETASICATASAFLTYDASDSASVNFLTFNNTSSLVLSSREFPYSPSSTTASADLIKFFTADGNPNVRDPSTSSLYYPTFVSGNSILFTGSATTNLHGFGEFITGSQAPLRYIIQSPRVENYFTSLTSSFGAEIWFKQSPGAKTNPVYIFGKANTGDANVGYKIVLNTLRPGTIGFQLVNTSENGYLVYTSESFSDKKFHCVSVMYNPSGSIVGNELVSGALSIKIIVDGKERQLLYSSAPNQINISGSNGSIVTGLRAGIGLLDVDNTPTSSISSSFNGRVGKLTLFNTGSLPSTAYLQYQYYASRSIFNN